MIQNVNIYFVIFKTIQCVKIRCDKGVSDAALQKHHDAEWHTCHPLTHWSLGDLNENFRWVIFNPTSVSDDWDISCKITLRALIQYKDAIL